MEPHIGVLGYTRFASLLGDTATPDVAHVHTYHRIPFITEPEWTVSPRLSSRTGKRVFC